MQYGADMAGKREDVLFPLIRFEYSFDAEVLDDDMRAELANPIPPWTRRLRSYASCNREGTRLRRCAGRGGAVTKVEHVAPSPKSLRWPEHDQPSISCGQVHAARRRSGIRICRDPVGPFDVVVPSTGNAKASLRLVFVRTQCNT